jgi:fructose-bisphosphate aldolase, class I
MMGQELIETANALVAGDKSLLAMDESNPTCNKRFAKLGIPQTEEARRAYRELIVATPGKDLAGHPGEKVTEGLDGLLVRLKEYFEMGARSSP